MKASEIAHRRLVRQQIAQPTFAKPCEVVRWMGAVQAQDYRGSLWAVGLRMKDTTEAGVEQAIADRTIVRTWPMRGTLHFVVAEDVRWLLKFVAARQIARNALRYQQLELDDATLARIRKLVAGALQGGRLLTRQEMYQVLERGKISTANQRGLHILARLAHEGLVCLGPRQGKQHTVVLLEEWVPPARPLERDEALCELARRYLASHGPATLQDFTWWSSLPAAEARAGLEMVRAEFTEEVLDGRTYWFSPTLSPSLSLSSPIAYLLPAFDEYTVAYKDRSAVLDPAYAGQVVYTTGILNPTMVVDGRVVGTWKRTLKDAGTIISNPFAPLTAVQGAALAAAARRYGEFVGVPVALS